MRSCRSRKTPSIRGWRWARVRGLFGKSRGVFRAGPPSRMDVLILSDVFCLYTLCVCFALRDHGLIYVRRGKI